MTRSGRLICLTATVVAVIGATRADDPQRPVQDSPQDIRSFTERALTGGDPVRGTAVFRSPKARCSVCHDLDENRVKPGPPLTTVGEKFSRDQLIQHVLVPGKQLHPDYTTTTIITTDGFTHHGILLARTNQQVTLINTEGNRLEIPAAEVEEESKSPASLMPTGLTKTLSKTEFADLIAWLETLQSKDTDSRQGMPAEIPELERPVRLEPIHSEAGRFDHPIWIIAVPGQVDVYLVVEQMTRKIWRLQLGPEEVKELFLDLSEESATGIYDGILCLAFHPEFERNGRYFVKHHVRTEKRFVPVVIERHFDKTRNCDSGRPSRRILEIDQQTDLHWGGMIAFGPDGLLYVGVGDGGPQGDPNGRSQDRSLLSGTILRIDVDTDREPYRIPTDNPFVDVSGVRPEIWAWGLRMPWRFSFDPITKDLWVGDVGQTLIEEIAIVHKGENHGWNVYEGFVPYSRRYFRANEYYTMPIFAYRRRYGSSVTGGYVSRTNPQSSWFGAYVFGDYQSKQIFALKQSEGRLTSVRRIGMAPEQIVSFGQDHGGNILLVGYEGTIFRMMLDESVFN